MLTEEIKNRAFRILEKRDMSAKELEDRLVQKGEQREDAQECVEWLRDLGIIDDARYAEMIVRHYASGGYGEKRITSEFFRRGIPREYWDEALEALPDQSAVLDRLVSERIGSEAPERAELQKLTNFLLRRGFDWRDISEAIARNTT